MQDNNYLKTPHALAAELGERLKRARLNKNMTQKELAYQTGVSRRTVINAEDGNVSLEHLIALLQTLKKLEQLDLFLPPQPLSPVQLMKLQGKIRQRASSSPTEKNKNKDSQDNLGW